MRKNAFYIYCLITRRTKTRIEYITQIGTGNYNEKTSKLYTDFSLMTASPEIGAKVNSLTDKAIIDRLIEASQAGVRIELIVRGICCLIPEIKGETGNIIVISIVGRFLEHSRIYIFGAEPDSKVYISSADYMTRNTLHRVEVAVPLYDAEIKERVLDMFNIMMNDNVKARHQLESGVYIKPKAEDAEPLNSQEYFYEEAYRKAGHSHDTPPFA